MGTPLISMYAPRAVSRFGFRVSGQIPKTLYLQLRTRNPELETLSWLASGSCGNRLGVGDVLDVNREVLVLDGVVVFEFCLELGVHLADLWRNDKQGLPIPGTNDLAFLQDRLPVLDDIDGVLEHLLPIVILRVDGDVGIRPDPQMPFVLKPKRPGRAGSGNDGDLGGGG